VPEKGKLEDIQPKDFFSNWLPFCKDYKALWTKENLNPVSDILLDPDSLCC
jgi:hypothetical protein